MEDKKEIGNVQIYNNGQINLATDHGVIYATQNNENNFPEKDNRIEEKCHEYAERYEEELPPMGDDSISVSLKQLYVESEYSLLYPYESKKEGVVFSYLKEFLYSEEKKNKKILFVEGDAGIGKTSLVSKIAYHYEHPNEESELGNDFFLEMRLICVRLRDMLETSQTLNIENPWEDIFQYLNIAKKNQRNESKRRSVLILDGFDELCMVESIQSEKKLDYFINLSRNLQSGRIYWKVIVTSRPNYINWESFNGKLKDCIEVIQLQHFSIEKRSKWIERAKEAGLPITQEVKQGMIDSNREELEAIIGVPWTLYLVARKAIIITVDVNLWGIYNSIFKGENVTRSFEEEAHPTRSLQNDLYQVTEEIAFWMYQNQRFDVSLDTIKSLIDRTYEEAEQKKKLRLLIQLKDVYALHTYYRKTDQRGGLAFYHNYIQDFFICEKIFLELDKTYKQLEILQTSFEQLDCLIACYNYLLSRGNLNRNTVRFIQARIQYECETNQKSMWIQYEQKYNMFIQAFEDMLWYGIGKPDFLRRIKRPVSKVTEMIFYNCWKIYGCLYQINNQLILDLFKEVRDTFIIPMKTILEILSKNVPLDKIELKEVNLSGADLRKTNLREVNLSGANLMGAYLGEANLVRANLNGVNLMKADLREANLNGSNLVEADLSGANLMGAELKEVDLTRANLSGANLMEANLNRANLNGSNLSGSDLMGADLSETDLGESNLSGTDLVEVNLSGANLNEANLSGADLRNANLNGADLSGANLNGIRR